jgi:SAM-dependent methyltransferase
VSEKRFGFGANWQRFARSVTPRQIEAAEASLRAAFGVPSLSGKRLLDVGSGSGLFSLAASRLGADVHSFDYDPQSVQCAESLRARHPTGGAWTIEQGDALDPSYLAGLGSFDIVYSWGVLHHTGSMWQALGNVCAPLAEGGLLYLALYRTKGWRTNLWTAVKKTYVSSPVGKAAVLGTLIPGMVAYGAAADMLTRPRHVPWRRYVDYYRERGMNPVWDWIDWLGGYPYETVSAREVAEFYAARGLSLYGCRLVESSMGNHEFLLTADPDSHHADRQTAWEGWRPSHSEDLPPG